jgi:hypothetical protein
LARQRPNLTVTMPTSSGKTNIAEWAILHALAQPAPSGCPAKLAVYVVPSRALAGEVERHLTRSLAAVGLCVSGLFGGSEHVQYELRLIATTDVLVVTSEKLDLLLRNDATLAQRLALLVVDEGHLLGERDRGLRLELVLTRVRRQAPKARILLLSAVLPNGDEVALWLEPTTDGRSLVEIDWSPSQLRIGVFTWQGKEEDGQQGVVRYRADDADHDFFLPFVLTRHPKTARSKKLFPSERRDVSAELAIHYERLGPVLIAVPRKNMAASAARSVIDACTRLTITLGADQDGRIDQEAIARRQRLVAVVTQFAGADHELVDMALAGVGYHHADVPEPIRLELEAAYRSGALRVLCATSTLGQGVNLPAKTVIVSGTSRDHGDEISVRDFWNTAGRAGRPFRETEGHVIMIAKDQGEAARLRHRYLDRSKMEPVHSTLCRLYVALVEARLGSGSLTRKIPEDFDFGDEPTAAAAAWAEIIDLQLLTLLSEEVVETSDEQLLITAVQDALAGTFGAVQLGAAQAPLRPLASFAACRIRALCARVADRDTRSTFLRTGLSLAGCDYAWAAADRIIEALVADPTLLSQERWTDLRPLLLDQAVTVTEVQRSCQDKKVNSAAVPALAGDWMDGIPVEQLRHRHGLSLGVTDPMAFASALDRIVVHDLAWVLSAILQMIELRRGEPAEGPLAAVAAMAKYGVNSEPACYAASIGVRNRTDAMTIGGLFPTAVGNGFPAFLNWVTALSPEVVENRVDADTAKLFLDRGAALLTPSDALALIVNASGRLRCPLRGVRYAHSANALRVMQPGEALRLVRDYSNTADPNATAVLTTAGRRIGYVAREIARVLAPLLDLEEGPIVEATLADRPLIPTGTPADAARAAIEEHDTVHLNITINHS